MRTGNIAVALAAALVAAAASGIEWHNLDDANWVCGPKYTPEMLEGKVILVDEWGVNCPPCRALLPRMEDIWQSFKSKGLVLIGSHRQGNQRDRILELRAENKLTYPIYISAGIDGEPSNGGGIPFIYVINAFGEVVYSGRGEREATAALVNALSEMPLPNSLLGRVNPVKFKAMAKDLVLGKNVESKMSTFAAAAKKTTPEGKEAADIIKAIEESKVRIEKRIRKDLEKAPGRALTDIVLYGRTWPSSASEFAEERKRLEAIPDVRKLQQAAASLAKLKDKPPRNSGQARGALSSLAAVEKQLTAIGAAGGADAAAPKDPGVAKETKDLLAEVGAMKKDFESLMPKKK